MLRCIIIWPSRCLFEYPKVARKSAEISRALAAPLFSLEIFWLFLSFATAEGPGSSLRPHDEIGKHNFKLVGVYWAGMKCRQ